MKRVILLASALGLLGCGDSHDAVLPGDAGKSAEGVDAGIQFAFDAAPPPDSGYVAPAPSVGSECRADSACGESEDVFCIGEENGFQGGYCSSLCDGSAGSCPDGSICVPADQETWICLAACDFDAARPCRAGYGCAQSPELGGAICYPGCTDNSDCENGLVCDPNAGFGGVCYDPEARSGDACETEAECPSNAFCLAEGFGGYPGGACARFGCDAESGDGCEDGEVCVAGRRGGRCLAACEAESDCREGYSCRPTAGEGSALYCAPACSSDSQCSEGRVCNMGTGLCGPPFDEDQLGGSCRQNGREVEGCTGGVCLREADTGFPGAYCSYVGCDPNAANDADRCPGDGVCVAGTNGGAYCLDGCANDSDCREAYTCRPIHDDGTGATACRPHCTENSDCANADMGATCNATTGLCELEEDD